MERVNHLKKLREDQLFTIYELHVKTNVSPTTISAIERWNKYPRSDVRARLAGGLAVAESAIWPDSGKVTNARKQKGKG